MVKRAKSSPENGGESELITLYSALVAFFRARLAASRRDLAEPLANDTLLAALVRQDQDPASVRDLTAFTRGIAENKLQDAIRKAKREERAMSRLALEHRSVSERVRRVAAEAKLLEAELLSALQAALRRLDPREREIITLRYNEELSNAEAAGRMGLDPEEASRLKFRTLEKLRALMRGI